MSSGEIRACGRAGEAEAAGAADAAEQAPGGVKRRNARARALIAARGRSRPARIRPSSRSTICGGALGRADVAELDPGELAAVWRTLNQTTSPVLQIDQRGISDLAAAAAAGAQKPTKQPAMPSTCSAMRPVEAKLSSAYRNKA